MHSGCIDITVIVSLHVFEYGYQWFVVSDDVDYTGRTVVMEFSNPCIILHATLLTLLCLFCAFDRLLLLNAMRHNIMYSASSHGQFIPSLTSNSPTSKPKPDTSVCKYSGFFFHCRTSCMHLS